jgi:hypothetical protein
LATTENNDTNTSTMLLLGTISQVRKPHCGFVARKELTGMVPYLAVIRHILGLKADFHELIEDTGLRNRQERTLDRSAVEEGRLVRSIR